MGFLWKKKAPPPKPQDPLAVYDGVLEALERQAGEVRKSAATLLALKGELGRDVARYQKRLEQLGERLSEARRGGDARAETTLEKDQREAERHLAQTRDALATAEADATLLKDTADDLKRQVEELKDERLSAKARLKAGGLVTDAMRSQVAEVERVLKLDAARDEVEKAHALAELYREDAQKKKLR